VSVSNAIEFVVHSQANHKMLGRKRLHKLILLGAIASDDEFSNALLSEAEFYIHHYGVYSKSVARMLDNLVFQGSLLKQSEPVGVFGSMVDTYYKESSLEISSSSFTDFIHKLSDSNTVLLEVAANIAFHIRSGKELNIAIEETEELKPVKSEKYLDKSLALLKEIEILP
jgi:hypothetical protein